MIFVARKSAEDTLSTIRILLERGCKELINEPDSLGNTPLHALLVRYALEEARYGFQKWNKWDILHLVRFLLQNGAKASINQAGNSALACVFRHVRDWEVCYELLNMLIKEEGQHFFYYLFLVPYKPNLKKNVCQCFYFQAIQILSVSIFISISLN